MVARPSDVAVEVTERLSDQRKKHDELVRSVGRGTGALRNASDQVLEVDDGLPLLKSMERNIGITFDNDQLLVVDSSGNEFKALKSGPFESSGEVSAGGNVTAGGNVYANEVWTTGGIRAGAGLSAAGDIAAGLRVVANNFMVTGNSIFSRDRDGAIRWNNLGDVEFVNRAGTGYRDMYYWLARPQAPSWRNLKTNFRTVEQYLGKSAMEIINGLDVQAWNYNSPDIEDTDDHLGPMLDEMPENLIVRKQNDNGEDRSTYDRDGLVAVLVQAYQELYNQHVEYREKTDAQLFAMRCELDDVKEAAKSTTLSIRLRK